MDFEKMKRKELQELCKKHGIPANLTNREMADRLASLLQKPEEPISRGRLSSNNVEEIDPESEPKDARPKMKKVRFSPNNETHIIVCSDSESAAPEKRRGRERQPRKRNETSAGGEASAKTTGSPLRRRKSSIRTPAPVEEEVVAPVLSPPVGKRRAEGLSSSVQNGNVNDKENVVSNMRQLRSRTVVVDKNAEVLDGPKVNVGKNGTKVDSKRKKHGDGLSETETGHQDMPTERTQGRKVTRQSKRDAEKDIDSTSSVIESERIENSRRATRSSFQPVQEAAVVIANNLEGGEQGECVKDSQTKDLPKTRTRNTRKSIAPSKGLPDEIVPLQDSNVIAERVIDVGNTRRSKRNKTRGGESLTLINEIAPETQYRVPKSRQPRDNASIHETKRGGVRILEEQKMSDQSSDTSKGLGRIDSRLVESDVYAAPKDDGGEGDLNDKKPSKRANRMVFKRRASEPEADSAFVEEHPVRRSRRLTIMTAAEDGEFQTDLADKMIMPQRRSKRSTKAKEVQDLNSVLEAELPIELPRQLKRNPSRRQSTAASKKQKSGSRDHFGGDMTAPDGTSTVQEVMELNALSPVQELLEHENIAEMKELPDSPIRNEDEEETAVDQELHQVKAKKDMVNSLTGNMDVSNKPTSPEDWDQEEVHLDADGAHTNNQSPQVLHAASGQDEKSAGLESIERQNKANCVISPNIPFSAERSNNMSKLSVERVTSTKEIENQSFLSGEDNSSTKVKQLVLEDQFDGLKETINADGNPVDTVNAADNLSPYESKNITFTIGMQHMESEHGLQSSNIVAEDAITRSNTSDNTQHTVHTASEERNRGEVQSSGYSSMSRIRTLEVEQDSFSETDSPAGTPHIGENDWQNPQDTLFWEERTLKEAGDNVNESQEVFHATEHPVEGVTVVFDENSSQISQEEEGGPLEVELESTAKDIEQESLEDISMIFPGEYTDMIEKHSVSVQFEGFGSKKLVGSHKQTAEEANQHEDGRAKLNAMEFNRCSMTISDEEGFYGQENELDMVTVTKAEGSVSHSIHPMHYEEGYGNVSAKKEDRKERASDVKDPLSFPQDCMEENMQGIGITEHRSETPGYDNYLEEGNKIPTSGLDSAHKEAESPVAYETLSKDATRTLCPEEWSPSQGEETLKSISPVHQANSLGTENLLTGSNKWIMDDSTCQDAATVQMKSKSDECYSGSSYINVLKAESDKDNQQLALGELSPETRAANASGNIGTDATPLESNKSMSSELAVKEHHAAEEADGLTLNSEISLGAVNAVNEDNVHPESRKELDLGLHEGISEEKDVEDAQSLENSSEACFQHVAPEDKAVKRTQSSDRSTQLKTPENKGGISPFNSDGSQHENSYYSCLEGEFKLCHDQAGKVVRNSGQTEWIRAPNSAAIRRDRCSLPCVTVESERCNTDIVVTDTHDMKGGAANKTHEDIEDYSTNNHDVEFQKSEGGTNLKLSNVTPFSSSKDLRNLDGDVEAPQRCNKEKICDFDCWEDEEIQLDQHRRMHSYGLSCIEMRTRSAETCDGNPDSIIGSVGNNYATEGDVSELSEQCLSHDTGNPKIEESADVTNSETTLDNTVDGGYESDDRVRMEEDIVPRKVDQSPVTAGEDPDSTIGSVGNNYATKGDESDLSKQSLSRDTGNSKIEDSADVTNSDIAHDSTGDARYESDDMVRMEEDMVLRKIDESPVSAGEDPMPPHELNTYYKEQHSVEGDEYNAPTDVTVSNSSGKNSDRNEEGFHIDKLFTEDECDSKEVPCEEGAKEQFLVHKVGQNQALSSYDLDVSRPMDSFYIESGSDCVMTSSFHGLSKLDGLSGSVSNPNHMTCRANYLLKQGSSTGLIALSSAENSNNETLLVEGQDKSHMVTSWEMNSISGHGQFDDPIKMIGDRCEKRLEDENFGDGAIALESEKNATLVGEGAEDEYKHTGNLEEHEKGLQDKNAGDDGDVVSSEFKKKALLVAEGPEDEHKHKKAESVDSIVTSDGFISREMLKEYKTRVQDTNSGDSGGIVAPENEENAVFVAEEAEDVHKHEKAESVNAIAPSDGLVLGEKLEEHEKRLQDTSTGDGGDVVSLELKEGALSAAEGLEVEPRHEKAEESVELITPFDGFIMREELEECEKILQDTNAGDSGDVAALEFEENADLVAEGPQDEHKHKIAEFVAPVAPSDGFMLREKLYEHGKEFLDVNALDGCGDVVALELKENALLAAEGMENEHKHRKADESVDSITPSDEFLSGEKLEKEIKNFRNDERECPEVSGSNEGSVDRITGRDSGGLMEKESREMTTLTGESDLNSGMLNTEETEVRLGSGNREDARGTESDVIKFEKISSSGAEEQCEEHRIQGEVTEDISSIKDSVDVLDVGDHDGSREQDDICAMIREYMDLELQKADSGDIFVSKETEVHGSCGSYNAPGYKPILEAEPNESREVLAHSAGADTSTFGDGSNIKHSIQQTSNLPAVCTENVSHDLAPMNLSAINDGNVAQKANMKKPKFSSYQKNRTESNPDESKKVALLMKSATVMRAKSRGNLIDKTPKKLFSTFEMKENMPSTKKEQIGSATATKTLTKRRALEDLQKKPIWK